MTRSAGTLFLFRKRDLRTSFIYAISLFYVISLLD